MSSELKTTPLMEQYLAIKANHKDAILFFRMGDFYEMFYEDAKIGSKVLGITLTARAHGKAADVPLAGFPHHALDGYLAKMIKGGYRVAICEQVEDPKLAKTIVKREVTEIVTPGTTVSDDLLVTNRNNYLIAICIQKDHFGLAQIDVSTGEFQIGQFPLSELAEKINTIDPAEILLTENDFVYIHQNIRLYNSPTLSKREEWTFSFDYSKEALTEHFDTLSLKGFGVENLHTAICSAGAVLSYLKENQRKKLVHIKKLARFSDTDRMLIDNTTRRNLELVNSMTGLKKGTLLATIDHTISPMGGRMFVNWLINPLYKLEKIIQRQDAVEEFANDSALLLQIREILKKVGDLERLLAKFSTARANARDAQTISSTLKAAAELIDIISVCQTGLLKDIHQHLDALSEIVKNIDTAVEENPPLSITDGGIIKRGYNKELDELRDIAYSGKDWIAKLQKDEREKLGIPSLKVNYNKVFGYYIEVTKANLSKVPKHYIRKQTLVNAERFITQDLKEYEEKILDAEDKMSSIEYDLFMGIRDLILDEIEALQQNAHQLATLDCLAALANAAVENNYNRPIMTQNDAITIQDGRHPVVEKLLPPGEPFVANDTTIDNRDEQVHIITGPNMAGKSTYLRQVGLIVIMAQMGGFVPARSAEIGMVDRVFTRVGASDNLAAGESTFLTEMNETANILNNATFRSLILLDEIGRGTSTFDGLSIAWSVAEYIHETESLAAKTIFATHYHELTELEQVLPRVKNYNVAVREWSDHIVFLRKIVRGGCDHSYGIQVAKLAGLPQVVIDRAKEVLQNLEQEAVDELNKPKIAIHHEDLQSKVQQLSLFEELELKLKKELDQINPDELTPLQALMKLDQLKQLSGQD